MIEKTAGYISRFLKISDLAIKGIAWKTHCEWQLKHKKTIAEIANMAPNERLDAVKELFDIGKKLLIELLSNRKKYELLVEIAFEKAFKLYLLQDPQINR